jgi:hypothetical protein
MGYPRIPEDTTARVAMLQYDGLRRFPGVGVIVDLVIHIQGIVDMSYWHLDGLLPIPGIIEIFSSGKLM